MAGTLSDIGSAAGEVWRFLASHGPTAADTARRKTGLGSNVFYAAVGWLAREDKLSIRTEGKTVILELKGT